MGDSTRHGGARPGSDGKCFDGGSFTFDSGGNFGHATAAWLLELVRLRAPAGLPRVDELALDGTALFFALGVSAASAVLSSTWPAWRSVDPQEALQSSGRSTSEGRKGHFAGKLLVAAEVALSTVLLLRTSLLPRSFVSLQKVDPGIAVQNLLTERIGLPPEKYSASAAIDSFYRRLLEKVNEMPSVKAAGTVSTLPLVPEDSNNPVRLEIERRHQSWSGRWCTCMARSGNWIHRRQWNRCKAWGAL